MLLKCRVQGFLLNFPHQRSPLLNLFDLNLIPESGRNHPGLPLRIFPLHQFPHLSRLRTIGRLYVISLYDFPPLRIRDRPAQFCLPSYLLAEMRLTILFLFLPQRLLAAFRGWGLALLLLWFGLLLGF